MDRYCGDLEVHGVGTEEHETATMAHIKVINIDPELHRDFRKACTKRSVSMSKRLIGMMKQDISQMKLNDAATVLSRDEIDELAANIMTPSQIEELHTNMFSKDDIDALLRIAKDFQDREEKNRIRAICVSRRRIPYYSRV